MTEWSKDVFIIIIIIVIIIVIVIVIVIIVIILSYSVFSMRGGSRPLYSSPDDGI